MYNIGCTGWSSQLVHVWQAIFDKWASQNFSLAFKIPQWVNIHYSEEPLFGWDWGIASIYSNKNRTIWINMNTLIRLVSFCYLWSELCQTLVDILGSKLFDLLLANNHCGFQGMVSLMCGIAFLYKKSWESFWQLVHKWDWCSLGENGTELFGTLEIGSIGSLALQGQAATS